MPIYIYIYQQRLSCRFGLSVWVFLITLYFDQRKKKTLINLKKKVDQSEKSSEKCSDIFTGLTNKKQSVSESQNLSVM